MEPADQKIKGIKQKDKHEARNRMTKAQDKHLEKTNIVTWYIYKAKSRMNYIIGIKDWLRTD